jgi:CheY-like chemotaxis protein
MGLAVVHGIIRNYGGTITVSSQPGEGTLFTMYLPVTGIHQEHDAYAPEPLPRGAERILFVDDEEAIAKIGGRILDRLGYAVETRTSSVEALELFRSNPDRFDLVITDMTMPNMTGDKLAMEVMKIRADIPVILCTGYSKKISDDRARQIGIKALVYKPIAKADFATTTRQVLDDARPAWPASQ